MEIRNSKFTHSTTKVFCEDYRKYNAPNHFIVKDTDDNEICKIDFQEGPIKECGINGVSNEDLLLMILTRLESFQASPYKCNENQEAIIAINEAVDSLRKRTNNRINRGVEGTNEV